jgi:hypothetical protein
MTLPTPAYLLHAFIPSSAVVISVRMGWTNNRIQAYKVDEVREMFVHLCNVRGGSTDSSSELPFYGLIHPSSRGSRRDEDKSISVTSMVVV